MNKKRGREGEESEIDPTTPILSKKKNIVFEKVFPPGARGYYYHPVKGYNPDVDYRGDYEDKMMSSPGRTEEESISETIEGGSRTRRRKSKKRSKRIRRKTHRKSKKRSKRTRRKTRRTRRKTRRTRKRTR